MSQFCVERNVGRFVERFAPRERLHVANNWDGKDCSPHHRRLAAAISASAPPEGWTEDTAPCAATVVAAETDFAFMERESRESLDGPAGRALSHPGRLTPSGQTLTFRSAAIGCIRGGGHPSQRVRRKLPLRRDSISQNALRVLGSRRSGAPGAQSTGR